MSWESACGRGGGRKQVIERSVTTRHAATGCLRCVSEQRLQSEPCHLWVLEFWEISTFFSKPPYFPIMHNKYV